MVLTSSGADETSNNTTSIRHAMRMSLTLEDHMFFGDIFQDFFVLFGGSFGLLLGDQHHLSLLLHLLLLREEL